MISNVQDDSRRKKQLIRRLRRDLFLKVFGATAIAVFSFLFLFGVAVAPGNDMFPAIHEGDVLIYFRPAELRNTDVVVYEAGKSVNAGRVQAMPDAMIDRTGSGLLKINGSIQPVQKQAGLYEETLIGKDGALTCPSRVPPGSYLILGDARESAADSRTLGYISEKDIKGKVFTIIRRRQL